MFSKNIAKRIRNIEEVMLKVANKNLTIKYESKGKDEISSLGRHLKKYYFQLVILLKLFKTILKKLKN